MVYMARDNPVMPKNKPNLRIVLAHNLKTLMAGEDDAGSQSALKRRSGVSQATIGRIERMEVDARIDTVQQIACAYGLEAWQLLVPGLNPSNPPMLRSASEEERTLYERLRVTVEDLAKLKQ